MSKECRHCESYSSNQSGCWVKGICLADMLDDRTPHWNRKLEPGHKCHREQREAKKRCKECGAEISPVLFEGAICPSCGTWAVADE